MTIAYRKEIDHDQRKKTVTIYTINIYNAFSAHETGYGILSLEPWSSGSRFYEGETVGSAEYYLPEGFSVGNSTLDEHLVWDDKGRACEFKDDRGRPCVITADNRAIVLRPTMADVSKCHRR